MRGGQFLLGCLAAVPLAAGQITLQTDVECESITGQCSVAVTNLGDESAFGLSVEAEVGGETRVSDGPQELRAGEGWDTAVNLEALRPQPRGRSAVILTVRYHDAGGYPSSAVAYGYLTGAGFQGMGLEAELSHASLRHRPEQVVLSIQPTTIPATIGVRLVLPDELRLTEGPLATTTTTSTDSTVEVGFEVENATAIPGGSFEALVVIEAGAAGGTRTLVVPATVSIADLSTPFERFSLGVIAFAVLLAAYALIRNLGRIRGQQPEPAEPRRWQTFEIAVLAALVLYLLSLLQPHELLAPTIATGGDTGSHYLAAKVLADTLLPAGELLGWMPGNLAGYPIFQLYFPLPFLLMAVMEPVAGLPVAFKLISVLGVLLLPIAAYLALRCLDLARPAPVLGAALTLPFLLNETNSVWGGNLLSTLAGEFSYSLAFSLLVLFVGTSYRGLARRRWLAINALLLAAIGLCHAYALLLAGAASAAHLLWLPRARANAWYLARVYGLAFALLGFWILPLLAYAPFTTPYRDLWPIESWRVLIPPVLWPPAISILGAGAWWLVRCSAGDTAGGSVPAVRHLALGNLLWVGPAFYLAAPGFGVVDVRFLPAAQIGLCLLAAIPLGAVLRRLNARMALTLLLALAVAAWSERAVEAAPQWANWNYSGYETKPLWPAFKQVNDFLAGDANDPRVAFEHSPFYNAVGTIRAFESLPLFSGRSTLEGLYIQSGVVAPEIFYLQSEYSAVASCPFPDYHCARLDLDRAAEHMRLFNASQLIARSPKLKAALAASGQFELERSIPPFEVHRLRHHDGAYVEPLRLRPAVLESSDWKRDFFRWFKVDGEQPLLLPEGGDSTGFRRLQRRFDGRRTDLPRAVLPGGEDVSATATIESDRIRIHTNQTGHPLLIKVAYHPRWRPTRGAQTIHMASPGFMLVYPEEPEVVLEFGATRVTRAGQTLSLLGVVGLVAVTVVGRRRWPSRRGPGFGGQSVAPRRTGAGVLTLLAALVVLVGTRYTGAGDAAVLYRRGLEAYKAERNGDAQALFERAVAADPLSSAALHASFYRGLTVWRQDRWLETIAAFEQMVEAYPESPHRAEAEYHIGLAHLRLGRPARARGEFETLMQTFPGNEWALRAAEHLDGLPADTIGDGEE